jgi:hypothetical protein
MESSQLSVVRRASRPGDASAEASARTWSDAQAKRVGMSVA